MRRLGLFPWLGVWLVLSGLQLGAVAAMFPVGGSPEPLISPLLALAAIVVTQLLKWPVTAGRLRDLGRPTDDAVLLLVPIVSLGLTMSLLSGTPSEEKRKKALKKWESRTLAPAAVLKGLSALMAAPHVTLPALAIGGAAVYAIEALAMPWFRQATQRDKLVNGTLGPVQDGQLLIFQILLGVLAVLGIWLVLQLLNRKKASRASWLPTLAMLPVAIAAVAFWPRLAELVGPDQAPPGFFSASLTFGFWLFGGGLLSLLWVALGADLHQHGKVDVGRALGLWRSQLGGALAVHGATATVIFLGLQALVIPGLVYALMMAFTVHIAVLHPDLPPFKESSRLTRGWWRPVFNVLALGFVPGLVLQLLGVLLVDYVQFTAGFGSEFADDEGVYQVGRMLAGWATAQAMPGAVPLPPLGLAVGAVLAGLANGAAMAGLVWTYLDRRGQRPPKKAKENQPAKA